MHLLGELCGVGEWLGVSGLVCGVRNVETYSKGDIDSVY